MFEWVFVAVSNLYKLNNFLNYNIPDQIFGAISR